MQPTSRDSERDHFAARISEADAPMRRIGTLAALGVMATTIGMLVLADAEAGDPSRPAAAGPAAHAKNIDSDYARAPAARHSNRTSHDAILRFSL